MPHGHASDDRRHRHPAADGQHGEPLGDRGPHHGAGLCGGAPPVARSCGTSGAGAAAGGARCHQPGWGDLKRRFASLLWSWAPAGVFPRRMGRDGIWAVLAARQPLARSIRHARAGLPCWGYDGLLAPPLLPSPPIRGVTEPEGSQTMTQETKATTFTRSSSWARSWPPMEPFAPRTRR